MVGFGYEASRVNDSKTWMAEVSSITEWFTADSPSGSPKRKIRPTWTENRAAFKNFDTSMPAGWTRRKVPSDILEDASSRLWPDGCSKYVYRHENMPNEDVEDWYFPFPVARIDEYTLPFNPEQTRYLFCETKKASLHARQSGNYNILNLQNRKGHTVRVLQLHHEEQLSLFPASGEDTKGKTVELVAICLTRKYEKKKLTRQETALLQRS
jgi:hypothetical protein